MKRTTLRNELLKDKREYSKQRNYFVSLVRKTKKLYVLMKKKLPIKKTFWKTTKLNRSYLTKLHQK